MAKRTVVIGCAGAGKTTWSMKLIEERLRSGLKWWEIGFASFSRAACLEAAQRASVITGVSVEKLQKEGFYRTLHSSALRCLGLDSKVLLDSESAAGKKWYEEVFGVPRGGEAGTLAAKVDQALGEWDKARARLSGFGKVFRIDIPQDIIRVGINSANNPCKFPNLPEKCHVCQHCLACDSSGKTQGFCADFDSSIHICKFEENIPFVTEESRREKKCRHRDILMEYSEITPYRSRTCEHVTIHDTIYGVSCPECGENDRENAETAQNTGFSCGGIKTGGVRPLESSDINREIHGFSPETEATIRRYEAQKKVWGKLDFTDILMKYAGIQADADLNFVQTYPDGSVPHEINLWILDEYQDCSALLDAAAARLSEAAEEVVMLGDTYQAVYGFSGSDWRVMRSHEVQAKAEGNRVLLNRSWRNPESVLSWGESVLREDKQYEERKPTTDRGIGSVGMIDSSLLMENLGSLANTDTMIIGRTWFALDKVKSKLDQLGIPWKSCQEKQKSRWEAPVRIAFVITMRMLRDGQKVSEQDWRRICEELPQKWEGKELFERGIKAKWKKMECRHAETHGLSDVKEWGATEYFKEFVKGEVWRKDAALLIDMAIEKYGVDLVREPKIRIGSVHSVKGAEARNVFCLAGSSERASGVDTDFWEDLFLKYVAITRASWNYRVVVDLVEHARGKPLFLACPKGYWKFDKEIPSELVGVEDTVAVHQLGDETAWSVDSEVSGRDLREDGNSRFDSLRDGFVRGDRDEEVGRRPKKDAGVPAEEDLEEWWNL